MKGMRHARVPAHRRHRHEASPPRGRVRRSASSQLLLRRVRRIGLAAAASVAALASSPGAVSAGAATTTLPVDMVVWVGCANDGAGEAVALSGTLHAQVQTVQRSATEWITTTHFNPQGVQGYGFSTLDIYRGVGSTGTTQVVTADGTRTIQRNNFLLIGPGPGNNLVAHVVWHATTDSNGSVVGRVERLTVDCG